MDSDWSVPPVCQNAKDLRHPQVALDDAAAGAGRQQQSELTLDPIVKFSRYCGLSQDQLKMPTVTGVQPERFVVNLGQLERHRGARTDAECATAVHALPPGIPVRGAQYHCGIAAGAAP